MFIYIVKHLYDNGEHYEDYREYEDYEMFSSFSRAKHVYWLRVSNDESYEGKYQLIKWELDTQKSEVLDESPWVSCSSAYDYSCWPEEREREEYLNSICYDSVPEGPNPANSIEEYWKWEDMYDPSDDIPDEEDKAWLEYVITPGTNYRAFKEVEEEIQARILELLNKELLELLNETK